MDQKDDEPPPFWLQSTTTLRQVDRHRRRNRHASSLFLNTGVLVIILLVTAILFLVIVIPYLLSLAKQVFNPSLVKSSWSSLNIVLVLFAIVCGFLGRKEDDPVTPVNTPTIKDGYKPEQNSGQWYGYQDRGGYNSFGNVENVTRLRRSSSSYPDLRQESTWMIKENKWRFYDDTDVENHGFLRSDSLVSQTRSFKKMDEHEYQDQNQVDEPKNIEVDTYVSNKQKILDESKIVSPSPSVIDIDEDESDPTSHSKAEEIVQGESESFFDEDESSDKNIEVGNFDSVDQPNVVLSPPKQPPLPSYIPPSSPPMNILPPPSPNSYFWPPPSPPPPPPPPSRRVRSSIPTKETNQTFETIGHGRYRWNNNNSTAREPKSKVQVPPSSPPPPPPAPPPRSKPVVVSHYSKIKGDTSDKKRGGVNVTKDFFTSFYHQSKRKRKTKRRSYENLEEFIEHPPKTSIHRSKSTPEFPPQSPPPPPPPPPPPLPPHSVFHNLFSKKGKTKKKVHSISTTPPPPKKPVKRITITSDDQNVAIKGNESHSTIPPPPPPPQQPPQPPTRTRQTPPKKPLEKTISFTTTNEDDQNVAIKGSNDSVSALRPIPPPPPPPFKMKPWQFVMQGDYVKIESYNNSPRSGYSASEDESISPNSAKTNQIPRSPLFCPSPDVNMKADDFIAKFRAKLTLEKSDSINLKQGNATSRLRPDSI